MLGWKIELMLLNFKHPFLCNRDKRTDVLPDDKRTIYGHPPHQRHHMCFIGLWGMGEGCGGGFGHGLPVFSLGETQHKSCYILLFFCEVSFRSHSSSQQWVTPGVEVSPKKEPKLPLLP